MLTELRKIVFFSLTSESVVIRKGKRSGHSHQVSRKEKYGGTHPRSQGTGSVEASHATHRGRGSMVVPHPRSRGRGSVVDWWCLIPGHKVPAAMAPQRHIMRTEPIFFNDFKSLCFLKYALRARAFYTPG